MGKLNDSFQLIIRSLRRYISLSFILALMIFIVRFYELVITSNYYSYPSGSIVDILVGLKFDIILYFRISGILLIPFLFIALFSQKAAKYFFITFSILLILGDMILLKYFSTTRVPLGADLFGYSYSEIFHTVEASGSLNVLPFIFMALFLLLMIRVYVKHVYFKVKPWAMILLTTLMFVSFLPLKQFAPQPASFKNEFGMFAATNKLNFFFESITNHFLYQGKLDNQSYAFKTTLSSSSENPFVYVNEEYPLLHRETTPDVLSEFIELGDTPANIVFVIVESLGRAYSGEGAYLGSYTPFLDSLMQKSLYWENCLSTSGRTFQVLPSILASLPFGDHGFSDLEDKMPDHISLISLLKKQANYSSTFVYGGEAEFDNMDKFLNRQGIDQIIDIRKFSDAYTTLPASPNGFTWGFGDDDIFKRYIEDLKEKTDKPRIDVLLTLAMHDPFNIPEQEFYIEKFNKRIDELDLEDKIHTFDHNYDKQFASILYFDDAFRNFINEYSKLPSFENTIFVITGDHRMPEIPISTQIDRFHVPLIIYSPMLKETRKFSSVVTHFDITPSLVAFLDGNEFISRPEVAAWMGHGLDNFKGFRSLNSYPLMRNKNEILDFIADEHFLATKTIYKILPSLYIEPIKDGDNQKELSDELDNFIRKNNYVCGNNKLIPDSLRKYTFH